jgi:hypothetical protein
MALYTALVGVNATSATVAGYGSAASMASTFGLGGGIQKPISKRLVFRAGLDFLTSSVGGLYQQLCPSQRGYRVLVWKTKVMKTPLLDAIVAQGDRIQHPVYPAVTVQQIVEHVSASPANSNISTCHLRT